MASSLFPPGTTGYDPLSNPIDETPHALTKRWAITVEPSFLHATKLLMSRSNVLPLIVAGGAAIGLAVLYRERAQTAPSVTPKPSQLARRNSEMAFLGAEGPAIRRKRDAEGHSGSGTMGKEEDLKRRDSNPK
jgi:hypothetical protein